MSYPSPMGLEPPTIDVHQKPQDWIPPPASFATVNTEGIDLNDEIFFNHTHMSYPPVLDPYAPPPDIEPSSSSSSLATAPFVPLQSAITTPDLSLASPNKYAPTPFSHYSHRRRFSSAVEQLNRMSLRTSESPSPEMYTALRPQHPEERTINPRQLLGNAGPDSSPAAVAARYILPSSVSSPSLSTFFARGDVPDLPESPDMEKLAADFSEPQVATGDIRDAAGSTYVMNDECVSAITYWLNNTDGVLSDVGATVATNPTGIVKPAAKRRNSIPVATRGDISPSRGISKRKRRKSVTTAIPEDTVAMEQAVYMSPKKHFMTPSIAAPSSGLAPESPQVTVHSFEHEIKSDASIPRHGSDGDDEPKPFPCPECDKQFKRSEHLKRHIRSVHSNIRPFHCKYCDKKFSRSDNLAQHSKTHFKVNANGTTSIIYGNPNPQNRGGRKKSVDSMGMHG
ncbi:putative zinc finger protein [Clavispora lusitaniae]|uniref:C2H2-type domain-containing protein n=2 Tax=Clavispora lusitaniae TaxID=36911 RepID=C4XZH4_CLAL4|nr:uncharacterized protein CLUG_01356 [Clavispora lusitaniae ATCC 42720]KAF7583787.1 Zinc finger, C2H2 type family protein [Clavispora lusitaniae]EEQ37234.1 hypothetical protein CLUG_01356 [Clavispora lusitaniae ATCC 42720]QFZ26248.1 putative zinc finger protein [Clavispora lusitaniae]QFZ31916.1 putative zinc finger protein [Clavispora lusitaniae]QFZ37585.1 putative zinc finger protein [Clavispora lusitaniae]